jgi:hypothetical protein
MHTKQTPSSRQAGWWCGGSAAAIAAGIALLAASFQAGQATHELRQRACNFPAPSAQQLTAPASTVWLAVTATAAMLAAVALAVVARRSGGPRVGWLPPVLLAAAVLGVLFCAYFGIYGAVSGLHFTPDCIG